MLWGGPGRRPVGTSLAPARGPRGLDPVGAERLRAMCSQALVRADASFAGVNEFGERESKDLAGGGRGSGCGRLLPLQSLYCA